jgi:hypothetical protein
MLSLFELNPKDRLVAQLVLMRGLMSPSILEEIIQRNLENPFYSLSEILLGEKWIKFEDLDGLLEPYKARRWSTENDHTMLTPLEADEFLSIWHKTLLSLDASIDGVHAGATRIQLARLLDIQKKLLLNAY